MYVIEVWLDMLSVWSEVCAYAREDVAGAWAAWVALRREPGVQVRVVVKEANDV